MEAIPEVVNVRDGVGVLDSNHVEGVVVHTQAKGSILVYHKEDKGETPLPHLLLELLEELLMLLLAHTICGQVGHLPSGLEIDGMVDLLLQLKARKIIG